MIINKDIQESAYLHAVVRLSVFFKLFSTELPENFLEIMSLSFVSLSVQNALKN